MVWIRNLRPQFRNKALLFLFDNYLKDLSVINVIIVDDEKLAREGLSGLLTEYFPNKFKIIAKCDSVDAAAVAILENQPDLVFLDIKMKPKNGFELLNILPQRHFEVVFTTAFDEYAVKAIRFSALDYLLKPISLPELRDTITRFELNRYDKKELDRIQLLLENLNSEKPKKIAFPTDRSIEVINISDILYCKADGSYCLIYQTSAKPILVSKPLKYVYDLLLNADFIKTHKSYFINTNRIIRFLKKEGKLELEGEILVPVSVRRKAQILELLQQLVL